MSSPTPRVFVLSDIHTDFPENLEWVEALSDHEFQHDAVILAGDVSDQLQVLETTLRLFSGKFAHVFFTPGNHDLWIRSKGGEPLWADSMKKLQRVLQLCDEIPGVHTKPMLLGDGGGGDGDGGEGESASGAAVWVAPVLVRIFSLPPKSHAPRMHRRLHTTSYVLEFESLR